MRSTPSTRWSSFWSSAACAWERRYCWRGWRPWRTRGYAGILLPDRLCHVLGSGEITDEGVEDSLYASRVALWKEFVGRLTAAASTSETPPVCPRTRPASWAT